MGDTFYVATTGNNSSGNGSIGSPWRTIQYGANQLSAGDTLLIRAGTYVESVRVSRSGTSGNPITIKAYTGETVIIDGQYTYPSGTTGKWLTDNPYVVHVSGDQYRYTPTNQTCWAMVWDRLFALNGNYITVEDITLKRSRGRGIGTVGAYNNCIIRNVTVAGARMSGATDGRGSSDILYEDCTFYDLANFAPFTRPAGKLNWPGAVEHGNMENQTFRRMTIHSVWGEGILPSVDTTVEDCIIYNTYSSPLLLEQASGATVQRNLIYHTWQGYLRNGAAPIGIYLSDEPGSGLGVTATINNVVRNNIVMNYKYQFRCDTSGPTIANNDIVNNTFVASRAPAYCVFFGAGTFSGNVFRNNISLAKSGGVLSNSRSSLSGWTFSNNLFSATPQSWLQGTGDEYGDPYLENVDRSPIWAINFQLTAASPAIDAGTSTDAPSDDYFGNSRSGTVDIGAHEYGAASATVTAGFTVGTSSGCVPLEVEFTNTSSNATEYEWYIVEPDDDIEYLVGTDTDLIYEFGGVGRFDVRLVATGTGGTDEYVVEGAVTVTDCDSEEEDCAATTEITVQVNDNDDDGSRVTASWTDAAEPLRVGDDATYFDMFTVMAFRDVAVPQGYTIASAHLELYLLDTDPNDAAGIATITGQDADSGTMVQNLTDYGNFARTTATVDWEWTSPESFNVWWSSTEIAPIIQEIVDRPGWASGNDIVILMEDGQGAGNNGTAAMKFRSHDGAPAYAPKLVITYAAPVPVPNFSGDVTSGDRPLSVVFTNSTTDPDSVVTGWKWEKSDDGGVTWTQFSTAEAPTHAFEVGLWSVQLTAYYGSSCSVSYVEYDYIDVATGIPPDWVEGGTTRGARAGMP